MNIEESNGYGYMIVRVTTARGAIPLENATVTIHNYDPGLEKGRGDVIAVYTTNTSGLTERFSLPAPPRENSLAPGGGKSYESYGIGVSKSGYYTQHYVNVPVFEGITAIQNAELVALPDNGQTDGHNPEDDIFFESENPHLSGNNTEKGGS